MLMVKYVMETFPKGGKRMKNIKKFLTLGLGLGLLGGAIVGVSARKNKSEVKAFDYETYIPMESNFFTNWTDSAGTFAGTDARFWGENYSFEALDTFFRGESAEGWTGTLTSRTWKQNTQYIYFQLGGAKDYDVTGDPVHLKIHYGTYFDVFYNNTFIENPMMFRYFKVPDAAYNDLMSQGDDFDMYIEIIDAQTSGYGFANFGYLHVNQTEESTSDAMRYYLNNLSTDGREWEVNKRKEIQNNFFNNEGLRSVFFRTVSNIDESFSSNDDFLKHWYFDYNFFNNDYGPARHFDKAIGTDSYRPDASTNMPFNNDGGFFRGWHEPSLNSGFVESDGLRYRFVSRPFVLSGTGLISIKMAGKASLHVLDATVRNSSSQAADLAWIDNKGMHTSGDQVNMALNTFNTTAMVNHVINLEAYLGKTIQLAICDVDTSGWSAAYFDTLVSHYASYPGFKVETAVQTNNSGTFYPVFRDIYINSAVKSDSNQYGVIYNGSNAVNTADDNAILNHVDASDARAAHAVWSSYLDVARGGNQGTNYCSVRTSDDMKGVLNAYNDLSATAKQIVCASVDFERVGGGDWYNVAPTIYGVNHQYNLARSIAYLAEENGIVTVTYSSGQATFNNLTRKNNSTVLIIVISVLSISTLAVLLVIKKRRIN